MKKMIVFASFALGLTGCVTMSGDYRVTAVRKDGTAALFVMHAHGSNIYAARNAFCLANPGATVSIVDVNTNKELTNESPYKCK